MAKSKDRTQDYRNIVRSIAASLGCDEAKLSKISAAFIMPKPRERSPFIKSALTTLESIKTLEEFIVKHRKDYVDLHRTTEQERDNIEHEVGAFIKACRDQIEILKNLASEDERKNSKTWLGTRSDNSHADFIAHKHGVVLILSEQLHTVTTQFDHLRSIRFQDAVNRVIPRRLHRKMMAKPAPSGNSKRVSFSGVQKEEVHPEHLGVQQQSLDHETRALQVELTNLLDAVQETERKMVEMSALNHLMSTHVLQQAQQIEQLYEQALEATRNVVLGNKELAKAIERNSSSRTFLLLFLIVLPLSLLFLDWYQ